MTPEQILRVNTVAIILSGLLANPNLLKITDLERNDINDTNKWFIERANELTTALFIKTQIDIEE